MVRPLFIKSFWWGVQLNIEDTNIQRADKVNKIDDTLKKKEKDLSKDIKTLKDF